MKLKTIIASLILLPLLGACNISKPYTKPGVTFAEDKLLTCDTVDTSIPMLPWNAMFLNPYLRSWIDIALTRNTDLWIAKTKIDEAAAVFHQSKLAFLPSLNVGADASTGVNQSSQFKIAPTASWEIDAFGKLSNAKQAAMASAEASIAYEQAVKTELIANVANGYYTLVMLNEQLSISERTLNTWEENIRVLQALKRAGRTNEAAVLQARANRLKVEGSVATLKNQIMVQENAIRSLLLFPEMEIVKAELISEAFADSVPDGIGLKLVANRPDVRQAEYNFKKCFYEVNMARAAFYPSITLSGSAGWSAVSGRIGSPSQWIANALGSIVAPLFNRGTLTKNLKVAEGELKIAYLQFQQTLFDAGMEVNNSLSDLQTAREKIKIDRKQVVALKGAVHNTRLLMRNTNTNYLEVLTAQQRLLEAELAEANDRFNAVQAMITLYRALGGGVD